MEVTREGRPTPNWPVLLAFPTDELPSVVDKNTMERAGGAVPKFSDLYTPEVYDDDYSKQSDWYCLLSSSSRFGIDQ